MNNVYYIFKNCILIFVVIKSDFPSVSPAISPSNAYFFPFLCFSVDLDTFQICENFNNADL